jgi:uncharacterized protein (TIGR03790 family)
MARRGVLALIAATAAAGCSSAGSDGGAGGASVAATSAAAGSGGGSTASGTGGGHPEPLVLLPKSALAASELGVLVNGADPQSVAVGKHYAEKRGIPASHVYTLTLPAGPVLSQADFAKAKAELDGKVDASVQAYVITWTQPYRVDCMSVTSAFALGFDTKYCNTTGGACGTTAPVSYFDSTSTTPASDHGVRPTMALATKDADGAKAVIDRGVAADGTFPGGEGHFVRTTDMARSVRWPDFTATIAAWNHPEGLKLTYLDNSAGGGKDYIENKSGVLFYFTGLVSVPALETNQYLPGAIADHLTSFGGQVPTSGQMSITRWLEVGATASYGTVVEPCNYTNKFPSPKVLLPHYFRGETLVEAYWKSVRWPGEGLFVGEPLARPWGTKKVDFDAATDTLTIETTTLDPKKSYAIESAPAESGPFTAVQSGIKVPYHQLATLTVKPATAAVYRLRVE